MVKVRLRKRWGSRLQGSLATVSPDRAKALVAAGIASYVEPEVKKKK